METESDESEEREIGGICETAVQNETLFFPTDLWMLTITTFTTYDTFTTFTTSQ